MKKMGWGRYAPVTLGSLSKRLFFSLHQNYIHDDPTPIWPVMISAIVYFQSVVAILQLGNRE